MYCIVLVMTQTMTTTKAASRVQVDAKSLFAKFLASENILVEHRASAPTAWFETDTRRLVLPKWNEMTDEVYTMLVAHEVAHALFSPKGREWLTDLEKIDPTNTGTVKGYFNIVEDARIERLIKGRFPGVRKAFLESYRYLLEQDKFELRGKNVAEMALIDRVNLHYKVGVFIDVPFSDEELPLVRECAETKTYEDALDLTRRLYEFVKEQKRKEQEQQQEQGDNGAETDSNEGGDESESNPSKGDGEETEGASGGSDEKAPTAEGEEEGGSQTSTGEGEAEDTQTDSKTGGTGGGTTPDAPQTDNVLQSLSDQHRDDLSRDQIYADVPDFDEKIGVWTPKRIVAKFDEYGSNWRKDGARLYSEFLNENRDAINLLAREFEQKRAADIFRRTRTADSGSVDPNRLWSYRIDENIFASYEVRNDGTNHGLIFYIDWSGSMSPILYETVKQTLALAEFCRKVNIPFEVHSFSDVLARYENTDPNDYSDRSPWKDVTKTDTTVALQSLRLINWLNGTLNNRDYRDAVYALLVAAGRCNSGAPSCFNLGGTPLNGAILSATTILPRFKRQHGVQIVHAVFLTDGEAGDYMYPSTTSGVSKGGGGLILRRNGVTSEVNYNQTKAALRLLSDANPESNIIGFYLESKRALGNRFGTDAAKKGFVCLDGHGGYDQWFGIVNTKVVDEVDHFAAFGSGKKATAATVRSAMLKELTKTRANRQFLSRFIDLIAKKAA
jgi:hypothetical protein